MLTNELLDLAKGPLSNAFNGVPGLENLNMNDLTGIAGKSVIDAMMQQMHSGNFNALMEMFSGNHTNENHEIVTGLENPVANNLKNQFGISQQTASQLAMLAIPVLLNLFNNKVINAQQTGGFQIGDLISQFISNQTTGGGGLMNLISNLLRTKTTQPSSTQDLFHSILKNFL